MNEFESWWASLPPSSKPNDPVLLIEARQACEAAWDIVIKHLKNELEVELASFTGTMSGRVITNYRVPIHDQPRELVIARARQVFLENDLEFLNRYTTEMLADAIEFEEDNRKWGCNPNFWLDDVMYFMQEDIDA